MANHDDKNDNHEELSPLLGKQVGEEDAKKAGKATDAKADTATVTVDKAPASAPGNRRYGWTANGLPLGHGSVVGEPMGEEDAKKAGKATDAKADTATVTVDKAPAPAPGNFGGYGWTADRLPLGHGSVVGEPMGRAHWDSSLFDCLGRSEGFCNSDLEVCLLGSVAPCVLYGNNAERVASSPGSFACHCLSYTGLLLLGNSVFGWNCLAPWLSFASRTTIRRKFNLEGSWEALHRSCGCCGCFLEDEAQREQCETACDFATHLCCHRCALCQEGRELRLRLPHPGFNAQPILVMIPPVEQSMGRGVGELPALV